MGMEERRKRLMASDSQPTRVDRQTTHVAGTREIFDTLCNCVAESTTVKPVGLLNHIVNVPLPSDTHRRLSTRGWTLKELLEQSERFKQVKRFPLKSAKKTIINFDETGVPCIIYDLHRNPNWPKHYTASWLKKHGPKEISVRNVYNSTDRNMLLDEFIEQSRRTAPTFASLKEKERLYGGDVKCPEQWEQQIRNVELVPSFLLPGNEEDLLPPQHVDTFKCHIGIADTFSSFHLDLCASSGHNLMCHTEGEGSSFWFMTEGKDASQASQYFENWKRKGQDHVLTVEHLAKAPFTIYVAEQKLGDLVLIPPRSCHQVVNSGGLTIKTSWSRMVLKGLEAAYYHELPMYRRVCWPEKYRVKSLIYLNLLKSREALASLTRNQDLMPQKSDKKLVLSTERLLKLFGSVLLEESPPNRNLHCLQTLPPDTSDSSSASSTLTTQPACAYCGANIFQSFFECLKCIPGRTNLESSILKHGDGLAICPGCYIEGRSCKCGNMDPIQCRPFQELLAVREKVAELLSRFKANPMSKYDDAPYSSAMRTFRAACLLKNMREKSQGKGRTCYACGDGPSRVLSSWVLDCKKCHRGRCFPHILMSQKLHAADAILINSSNSLHEEYRGSFLQNYKKGQDHLIQTQQFGCKPDPTQQRVRLAEQYRRCRPVNPNFVQAGWYDVDVEVLASKTEIEQDLTNVSQSLPLESGSRSSSPSASFDSPLSSLSELSELDVNDVVKSTLKRKRQVLDFVFVPNQPYKRRVLQKPTSIAATPDSSDLRGVVSCVQYISSSPTPSLDAVEVSHEERSQDRQAMQGQSPDPPGSPEIVTRDKSSSQSSASGAMTSSLNSETSTLPAAKKSRTARRVIEEPDIPSPPTPPRSRSTSSTTTESSQTQQSSQLQEAPVRTVQHSSSLPPTTDTEPRRMLTDRIITKRRKRKLSLNESSSKRAEVSRRQTNSSTPTVDDLAEALNTAAFHNHSASYDVDVDHFSNPTTSHDVSKEVGIPASTSATKVPSARTGLSRSSPAASGMVRERDQGNIQIDPRLSPSIGRHSHRNPVQSPSLRSTPSLSETDVRHSTSINVEKNATATAEHPPVKRRVHSTLPAPTLSLPTPSSSKSSVLPTRQHQTKVVAPAQKGETFRGGPRQLPPRGPISCDRATPEASSHDPLPAMSGFTGLVSASSSIATGSQSVRDASDSQSAVPANVTPSKNNSVPDVAPPAIPVDGNPLEIAVQELQSAIHDSEHIPSRVVNAIVALADAMNKLAAQHNQNSQNLQNPHAIHPPWSQGNYPSMFQQPYTWPALWWGPDYQHFQQLLSQYREMFPYCTVPSFDEGYTNPWSSNPYPSQASHYDDGSRMRSGYSYGQRRFQPYREDFERRPDNRNHPFTRPRYNAAQDQDRPSRPMWSENARHRAYPSNPGSHRRTFSGEGRIWDRNSRQSEPVNLVGSAEAGSAGAGSASSPSSSLHNTGGSSDKSNNADNLMDRADPHQDHSLCRSPSSITNQSQSSCPLDTLSQAPVQQSGQAGSVPPSPHPAPSADLLPGKGRSITELDCRTVTNKEGGREQKETAMDDDLSQKEHPASQSINLQNSLYANPWA